MSDYVIRDSVLLERYRYIIKYCSFNQVMLDLTPVLKTAGLLSYLAIDLITRTEIEIAYLQNNSYSVAMKDEYEDLYPDYPEYEMDLKDFIDWVLETLTVCSITSYTNDLEKRLLAEKSESPYVYSSNAALEFMLRCLKVPFLDKELTTSCILNLAYSLYESDSFSFSCIGVVKQISLILDSEV